MTKHTILPPTVTAVILAGGQARRMGGKDKGLLLFRQRPLVEHVLQRLQPQVEQIVINANRHLEQYRHYDKPVIRDDLQDYQGPLAGMLAALQHQSSELLLTAPCDSPFIPPCYRQRMVESLLAADADLAVASDGKQMQPVFCLLKSSLTPHLQDYLAAGHRKVDSWLKQQRYIEVSFADHPELFLNLNTPADLDTAPPSLSTVPIVGFAAFSGTGKTTLLTRLLPLLQQRGLRVAVIKHAHHQFDIDKPGKDSYELREAGACPMLIASSRMTALIEKHTGADEHAPQLDDLIQQLDRYALDLILVEGFKHENVAKIELHRPSMETPLLCVDDPHIIAVASDETLHDIAVPQLDINDISAIADFVERFTQQWNA